jgi:hypothetical protein
MSGLSRVSRSMSSACWLDTTTVSRRVALPSTYSMVTWVLPSGRQRDRQRHQLGGLVAGVAEHEALVARALALDRVLDVLAGTRLVGVVHALRDVGRLAADRDAHAARLAVEALA